MLTHHKNILIVINPIAAVFTCIIGSFYHKTSFRKPVGIVLSVDPQMVELAENNFPLLGISD